MGKTTNISWSDATLNPIYGCSRISDGCKSCYAELVVAGLERKFSTQEKHKKTYEFYKGLTKQTPNGPRWTGIVKLNRDHLDQALRWQEPKKIFLNSLSDTFHESLPTETIEEIFVMMALAHWHTFQVLTKRADRMLEVLSNPAFRERVFLAASLQNASEKWRKNPRLGKKHPGIAWPLKNVWLGVSVEAQKEANVRIPLLMQTPAAVRFLSCEPLLGPVNLRQALTVQARPGSVFLPDAWYENPHYLCGKGHISRTVLKTEGGSRCLACGDMLTPVWGAPNWVIIGGESGANFRPMKEEWATSLVTQCRGIEKVAVWYKQGSAVRSGQNETLDMGAGPIKIQEFPV